jgi:hypothetical protein
MHPVAPVRRRPGAPDAAWTPSAHPATRRRPRPYRHRLWRRPERVRTPILPCRLWVLVPGRTGRQAPWPRSAGARPRPRPMRFSDGRRSGHCARRSDIPAAPGDLGAGVRGRVTPAAGSVMTTADTLDRGRESFERRAWADAFVQLSAADRDSSLGPEDLGRLATAAYLVGRDADSELLCAGLVAGRRGRQGRRTHRQAHRVTPAQRPASSWPTDGRPPFCRRSPNEHRHAPPSPTTTR